MFKPRIGKRIRDVSTEEALLYMLFPRFSLYHRADMALYALTWSRSELDRMGHHPGNISNEGGYHAHP